MDGLIAFLNARLNEDEATAKTATAGPWEFEGDDPTDDEIYSVHDGIVDLVGVTVAFTRDRNVANGQHIALHDAARVLREVEAKRAIIAGHGPPNGGRDADRCRVCTAIAYTGMGHADARRFRAPCPTLLFLAAVWSDHPDYRKEWKP